jgi:hypothetical protein
MILALWLALEEKEEEREDKWVLMRELALARAPRHFVRVLSWPYIYKVILF